MTKYNIYYMMNLIMGNIKGNKRSNDLLPAFRNKNEHTFSEHVFVLFILLLILSPVCIAQPAATLTSPSEVPEIVIPVYDKLKDMHVDIPLAINGKAVGSIVTPAIYRKDAEILQAFIEKRTGVKIPVIGDGDAGATVPFRSNLIILGNRSTSLISRELYDRHYSLMDLKYPGSGGYAVRSLHNPYGNGYSAILIGGSNEAGVSEGVAVFIAAMATLPASAGNLKVGWTMLTKLGKGMKLPADIREFVTWEAREGAGHFGFGWNSISARMAAYYMTGDPFHAREVIRLSFPDAQALKEIDEIDGERIENKKDPLAGPYHYNATMTILYWDLIEESPVFSDDERLKATNAFARRINHEGTTPFDKNTYKRNTVPDRVGSRHVEWSALSLITIGRYFNKYYPSPMWAQAERAGKLSFASLHNNAWLDIGSAYSTNIAAILTYMTLTGDRVPAENGVLKKLLEGMEVLITGNIPDRALLNATLDFLNKATYLSGDGRWITYRQRTGMNTDIFRLGQSFWPEENIKPAQPADLVGKWLINFLPEPMWEKRRNNFTLEQSFMNMSYRSTVDASGDYVLVDGFNEAYRNPYHTYDILELRLNGETLLRGYNNQVLSSADGMVEPVVAMNAALIHYEVVGQVAGVTGEVPNLPFVNWRRTLALRTGQYVLIADDFTFRSDNQSSQTGMLTRLETCWEIPLGGEWIPQYNYLRINTAEADSKRVYEIHSSELMNVRPGKVTTMVWQGSTTNGQKSTFFHLLGQNSTGNSEGLKNIRLEDNAAALALPEAALAVSGQYRGLQGDLVLLTENTLYGHSLRSVVPGKTLFTSDVPVEADWVFDRGTLSLVNSRSVKLTLAISSPEIILDGKKIAGRKVKDGYSFDLSAGRHEITGAVPSSRIRKIISVELRKTLKLADQRRKQQLEREEVPAKFNVPVFTPVMKGNIGGSPVESVIIPSSQGELIGTATGNTIIIFSSDGKQLRKITTSGDVRVLHWWAEQKLLLAGCADEQVFAFDEQGQKKWEFTSVMDPAVYEAGKPYWFKSAHPGIYGLYSGDFDNGKNRAFIGSACTLEVLDENGTLVKRIPVFWGPGRQFLMVNASDGSRNLLIGRWLNGYVTFAVINSKNIEDTGRGYARVPVGHTFVDGWTSMNRFDNFLTDLDNDGKREVVSAINGTWNRVTVYSEDGKPLYNAQFGPGLKEPRANIRMMDVGDLNGDGKQEIVVGLSSGFVNLLDSQANKLWAKLMSSPPTVVKMIKESSNTWLCVGCEDGTVVAMDKEGNMLKEGRVSGKPLDIKVLQTPGGPLTVIITDKGEVNGFQL